MDGPILNLLNTLSATCERLKQERDALRKERDELRTRAVMAENHKALNLLGRSSEQEAREDKLRYALAEAEIRAETAESQLATLTAERDMLRQTLEQIRAGEQKGAEWLRYLAATALRDVGKSTLAQTQPRGERK